ncbi:MAG: glycosyltransferase family 4 protein, partial [Acidobacteriota bacterium]|nr:glycosyltransferase family 4 protein [Acidobacteriota bacterium]
MSAGSEAVNAVSSAIRIDYVSPLPPVRSGIADYSRDLLPHLSRHCDLRVIAVPGQPIDAAVRKRFQPVAAGGLGADGRLPLYQMGNNPHHAEVWKLAVNTPGVVTLHDVVLHHLLIESTLGRGDHESYARRLEADHGWIGRLIARARRWGELSDAAVFELPAHRDLVRHQRGVLVHSEWAAFQVREENPDVAVRVVPMGVPLPERVSQDAAAEFRRKFGLPEDRPLLGSFGFQTPIKRTDVAVRALAEPGLADAHLVIAGEVSETLDLEGLAQELGVSERVHVTGFLDYGEFEAAITACDLCLNLRYPTAGETSASLLRVLALGRPALVSDYAQFAELPAEVALKVPLGEAEVASLANVAAEAVSNRKTLQAMGEAARRHVRELHDPDLAARSFVAACGELAQVDPPGPASVRTGPPTTLLWQDLPGEIEVRAAEAPWPEGAPRELSIRLGNSGPARWLPTKEDPGGVILDVQWRRERGGEAMERTWAELPHALDAGEHYDFRVELRRPRGSRFLVV